MTSATERLRALLDERGVEHIDPAEWLTYWHDTDGHVWSAMEMSTGLLSVSTAGVGSLTPEQAVAATLGPETCRFEQIPEELYDDIECSECGVALWGFHMDIEGEGCPTRPRYCPNCGRKVVE